MTTTTSDRVLGVLALFTIEHPEWTVEAAASHLGLPISTAYRYVRSLSRADLLVARATGRYVLGPAIIQYDRQIRLHDPLTSAAQPVMKRLSAQLPPYVLILLCGLFRNQVMCIHQESAKRLDYAVGYERGRPMPLFRGSASKIILAYMPLRSVKVLYDAHAAKFAQGGLGKNWSAVKERLRVLRSAGASVTQGEVNPGMTGVSVPVFEAPGCIVASLSGVIPVRHMTAERLDTIVRLLQDAARQVSWAVSLGSQEPQSAFELHRPKPAKKPKRRRSAAHQRRVRT